MITVAAHLVANYGHSGDIQSTEDPNMLDFTLSEHDK